MAAARDGPYTEGYLELDRRPTQRYHLRSPQWRRLYHIIFAGVEGEGTKDIKKTCFSQIKEYQFTVYNNLFEMEVETNQSF